MKLFELMSRFESFDLDKFKTDCAPFLNELKGAKSLPYHGTYVKTEDWDIREFKPREGPRDMSKHVYDGINAITKKKFGHEIRKWMFITGNAKDARMYGPLHVVFPIGSNYHYVWSNVDDLHSLSYQYRERARADKDLLHLDWNERNAHGDEQFLHAVDNYIPFKVDEALPAALASDNEIHLSCEKFYIFNVYGSAFETAVEPFLKKSYPHHRYEPD